MARFNELQVGRYNRYFQKILSMKGPATVVTIADEIIPVLPLIAKAEDLFMQGWDAYALGDAVAGVAADQTVYALRNPAGSNVIAVISRLNIQVASADTIVVRMQNGNTSNLAGSTPGIAAVNLDTRSPRRAATLINTFLNSAAPPNLGQPIAQMKTAAAGLTPVEMCINTPEDEIVLAPDTHLEILTFGVNNSMQVTVRWRERFLEDSERS